MSASWLDIMPAIPLAKGLPVIAIHDTHPGRNFKALTLHDRVGHWTLYAGGLALVPGSELRVDLDDPQGFGYALRWLDGGSALATERSDGAPVWAGVLFRHLSHQTTGADRLELSQAIAEVMA